MATVVLFSTAIVPVFLFAGVGLIARGAPVLAGFPGLWITFPFLPPLLIPLPSYGWSSRPCAEAAGPASDGF